MQKHSVLLCSHWQVYCMQGYAGLRRIFEVLSQGYTIFPLFIVTSVIDIFIYYYYYLPVCFVGYSPPGKHWVFLLPSGFI